MLKEVCFSFEWGFLETNTKASRRNVRVRGWKRWREVQEKAEWWVKEASEGGGGMKGRGGKEGKEELLKMRFPPKFWPKESQIWNFPENRVSEEETEENSKDLDEIASEFLIDGRPAAFAVPSEEFAPSVPEQWRISQNFDEISPVVEGRYDFVTDEERRECLRGLIGGEVVGEEEEGGKDIWKGGAEWGLMSGEVVPPDPRGSRRFFFFLFLHFFFSLLSLSSFLFFLFPPLKLTSSLSAEKGREFYQFARLKRVGVEKREMSVRELVARMGGPNPKKRKPGCPNTLFVQRREEAAEVQERSKQRGEREGGKKGRRGATKTSLTPLSRSVQPAKKDGTCFEEKGFVGCVAIGSARIV